MGVLAAPDPSGLRRAYQDRADALHRSARESLAAAERTMAEGGMGRQARLEELESQLAALRRLDRQADELATELAAGGGDLGEEGP